MGREDSLHNAFRDRKQQLEGLEHDIRRDELKRLDSSTCGDGVCGGEEKCQREHGKKDSATELNAEMRSETLVILDDAVAVGSIVGNEENSVEGSDAEERNLARVKRGPGILGPIEVGMSRMKVLIVEVSGFGIPD